VPEDLLGSRQQVRVAVGVRLSQCLARTGRRASPAAAGAGGVLGMAVLCSIDDGCTYAEPARTMVPPWGIPDRVAPTARLSP